MPSPLATALAGAAAAAAGNGLARFAFVPLFPAMVAGGWVDGGQAGTLGAAALAGYLIGVLSGGAIARRLGVPGALDLGMAVVVVALAACVWNGGFWWFLPWRTLAGIGGGFLMALAGPAVQAVVPAARRGGAGGIVLAGVGTGVAVGGLIVPALLGWGLPATWAGLAALSAALWLLARPRWPRPVWPQAAAFGQVAGARLLLLTYALHATGMVAPMIYLADLAARGRGLGVTVGAWVWVVSGIAGIAGGILSGRAVDRIGGRPALVGCLVLQSMALALCLVPGAVWPASALAGFAAVGTSAVALSVARLLAPEQPAALWMRATAAWAVAQTVTGFALAALFAATEESHAAVFGVGLVASVAGVGAAVALWRQGASGTPAPVL